LKRSIDQEDWEIHKNILRPFDEDEDDNESITIMIKGDKKAIKRML